MILTTKRVTQTQLLIKNNKSSSSVSSFNQRGCGSRSSEESVELHSLGEDLQQKRNVSFLLMITTLPLSQNCNHTIFIINLLSLCFLQSNGRLKKSTKAQEVRPRGQSLSSFYKKKNQGAANVIAETQSSKFQVAVTTK